MATTGLHYEDFEVGQAWRTMPRTITEADLVHFVGVSGLFERLFVDAEYAVRQTPYRARLIPAALTYSVAEGLTIQLGLVHETGLAFLEATIRVKAPVAVGDTLHVGVEVTDKRETSKPDRGLVRTLNRVVNQRGECVLEYDPLRLIKRRLPEGAR